MLRRTATRCSPSAANSKPRSAGRASIFACSAYRRDPRRRTLRDRYSTPSMPPTPPHNVPSGQTTTSTQAPLLINGGWTLARAPALADRLVHFEPALIGDRARIVLAYRLTLGRGPDPEEIAEARMCLAPGRMSRPPSFRSGRDDRSALVDFCHVLSISMRFCTSIDRGAVTFLGDRSSI